MAAQALYRKYRSQNFEEVVGQEHVTTTLRNALREGRIAHAYLFSGPRGTGKTSTARILAKAVNCLHPAADQRPDNSCAICVAVNEGRLVDLVEMDAASHTSVDNIRELIERVNLAPTEARYKVYVIDEVHMLSHSAFNALLKTLEEPPSHVIFVLATTEPHKIPETVLSRCQRFDFRRIPLPRIVEHLQHILAQEDRQAEQAALEQIAMVAEGCMRDAVSLLDQLLSYGEGQVTLEQVEALLGAVPGAVITRFVDALAEENAATALAELAGLVAQGVDLRRFTNQLIRYLRDVMLVRVGGSGALSNLPAERLSVLERQAQVLSTRRLVTAIRRLAEVSGDVRSGVDAQLALELALVEIVEEQVAEQPTRVEAARKPAPSPTSAVGEEVPRGEEVRVGVFATGPRDVAAAPALVARPDAVPVQDEEALQRLRSRWKQVISWFRENRRYKIQAALGNARPVRVGGGTVDLVFKNQFSLDLVQRAENLRLVEALVGKVLGSPQRVYCALEETYVPGGGESGVEAGEEATGQSRMSEIMKDDLVREAVARGGRIVDIQ